MLSKFVIYHTLVTAVLMAAGAIGLFHHVYSNDLAAGVPAALALRQAQTITVSTVILFQIFYVFVGVGVLLQVAFIYFPFLQGVFGSSPIEPYDLWLATLVGASVLPLISLEKWWRGRATRKA